MSMMWQALRLHSANNVPSQVRTLVVPEVPCSVRGHFRQFRALFFGLGRFQRRCAPEIHQDFRFLRLYGTLFNLCTRIWQALPGSRGLGELRRGRTAVTARGERQQPAPQEVAHIAAARGGRGERNAGPSMLSVSSSTYRSLHQSWEISSGTLTPLS